MEKKPEEMRLGALILPALNLAIKQKDIAIAEMLARALEAAMTRKAGGAGFVERRNYPEGVLMAFQKLDELKNE